MVRGGGSFPANWALGGAARLSGPGLPTYYRLRLPSAARLRSAARGGKSSSQTGRVRHVHCGRCRRRWRGARTIHGQSGYHRYLYHQGNVQTTGGVLRAAARGRGRFNIKSAPPAIPFGTPVTGMYTGTNEQTRGQALCRPAVGRPADAKVAEMQVLLLPRGQEDALY